MDISSKVQEKLRSLPDKPGVYLMRDRSGRIIYVGKATSLRNRVRHYFQSATLRSGAPKLRGLVRSIDDLEFIVVRNEAEAILVEGRMIKEYRPRFNVAFKDDKRFLLLRVQMSDPFPRFETCRIDRKDGATYFGPYANSDSARATLEFIEKHFGIRACRPLVPGPEDHRHCHNDIVRFCAAPCIARVTPEAYRERVEAACAFLHGERNDILEKLDGEMKEAAANMQFERAANLRDLLLHLRKAVREKARGEKSLALRAEDARAGVRELESALHLPRPPSVIECFDISNISGTHAVASMVCAVDGMPHPQRYRHFRIKSVEGSDDPASMAEVIRRRYSRVLAEKLPLPDLVLIDGGVTQLGAARRELAALGLADLPSAGLAKRFEEVYLGDTMSLPPVYLPRDGNALKVLQRIRDEAHRFALTHHRTLRARLMRESVLDEVEGIGEKRKELLLKHFGSALRLRRATVEEITAVPGIGPVMARQIKESLSRLRSTGVSSET